jgi:hypothetical protein
MYHPRIVLLENIMNAPWTDEKSSCVEGQEKPEEHSLALGQGSIYDPF